MPDLDTESPLFPAPLFAPPEPSPNRVFIGPLGLRAGWGLLLYLFAATLLLIAIFFGIAAASGKLPEIRAEQSEARLAAKEAKADGEAGIHAGARTKPPTPPMRVSSVLVKETAMAAGPLLAAFGISFLERRRFWVYGMGRPHFLDILPGAAVGLLAMGLLVGGLRALHLIVFDGQLDHGGAIVRYGLGWLVFFFLVGVGEEFLFRGYLQFTLMRGLLGLARRIAPGGARPVAYLLAGTLTSLLFFAVHTTNTGENKTGLLGVFLAGVLFCYALWRTGSLWWGIGFHATWDWSQSFLYGTADSGLVSAGRLFSTHPVGNPLLSGGAAGPEGSLLLIPVLLLVMLALRFWPKAEQPPLEPELLPDVGRTAAAPSLSTRIP